MDETPVLLKNVVELPAKNVAVSMGRAAVTSRVATTEGARFPPLSENVSFLSAKPIRRPASRKLE